MQVIWEYIIMKTSNLDVRVDLLFDSKVAEEEVLKVAAQEDYDNFGEATLDDVCFMYHTTFLHAGGNPAVLLPITSLTTKA